MHTPSIPMLLGFFLFFFAVQTVTWLGCFSTFKPCKNPRRRLLLCIYAAGLNSAYLFLFSPPAVAPAVKALIEYALMYPFFIYMLLCLVLAPFFIISGVLFLIIKLLSRIRAALRGQDLRTNKEHGGVDEQRRTLMKFATSTIVLPIAGCSFYGAYIGKERLKVEEKTLSFNDLPEAMDGFVIVQISDIHTGPFMDGHRLAGFVGIINKLGADIVVITGDLINWGNAYVGETADVLSGIQAPSGVFVILGNHDFYCDVDELCSRLNKGGIRVLRNRWTRIAGQDSTDPIYLLGIDDARGSWYLNDDFPYLNQTLADLPEKSFKILLCHRPNVFNHAARSGIQLTLSGHTHGGQFIMPSLGGHGWSLAKMAYQHDYGLYRKHKSYLYVNKGLGVVGPPVRINCPREISRFVLKKA